MDQVPEELPTAASRLIAMAVSLVGESESVREAMKSSPEDFRDYSTGQKEPSSSERDRLVNLIISEQDKLIAEIRAQRHP